MWLSKLIKLKRKISLQFVGFAEGMFFFFIFIRNYSFYCNVQTWADPGFLLGRGALVSCSPSTPINHIVFFLQNTSFIRKPQVIWGRGVRTPCTLPPRSAPVKHVISLLFLVSMYETLIIWYENVLWMNDSGWAKVLDMGGKGVCPPFCRGISD